MSFLKKMLNANVKRNTVPEEKTTDNESDMEAADIFEDGHKLTALENIGSSLTTLWSNCGLDMGSSSRECINSQSGHKIMPNTSNEIASATAADKKLESAY